MTMKLRLFSLIYIMCLCASVAMAQIDRLVFSRMDASDGLNDNHVQHIMQLPDGRMAVTTLGNINIYDGAKFRYIHTVEGSKQKLDGYHGAYHVYIDRSDRLWVKDWHWVQCFSLRQGRYVTDIDSLFRTLGAEEQVLDLFVDSDKNLWLVTGGCVVNTSTGQTISLPTDGSTLQDLDVDGGQVYLFFSNCGVRCYDGNSDEVFSAKAYESGDSVRYSGTSLVVKSPDGSFYQLRNGHGAVCLRFSPAERKWDELLRTDYTLHTLVAPNDSSMFITTGRYILRIDTRNNTVGEVPLINVEGDVVPSDGLNTMFLDNQSGVWLGAYDTGLLYAHPSRFRIKSYKDEVPESLMSELQRSECVVLGKENHLTCRFTDSRGWIWYGSPDGLYLYTDTFNKPIVLYTEDGLSNCYVYSLTEDNNGDLWAATSYGINRVSVPDGGHEGAPQLAISSFTEKDGTLSCAYRSGQAVCLESGHLLFRGLSGYTMFHPDSIAPLSMHIHPILTGVALNGERLAAGHPLLPETESYVGHFSLDYDENNITFDIASLNYCLPEHTVMEYRILSDDGVDEVWHTASLANGLVDNNGVMHLSLVKVVPGDYWLQVRAAGVDEEQPLLISFRVNPPWWQTVWAKLFFALALIVAIVVANVVYMRVSRMRMRQRHKEEILLMRIRNLIERCDTLSAERIRCYETDETDDAEPEQTVGVKEEDSDAASDTDEVEPQISVSDNEFIRRAIEVVERNINTRGYSVEQLSRDLCMERTGLYKKMTTLLDKSPSLFIRSIRMQRAEVLLRETNLSISEIAERTGFSSTSHMSKCFQEELGCAPSRMRQGKAQ